MQIDIKGRNVTVTEELRKQAERRLEKVARQVSDLARLEIEAPGLAIRGSATVRSPSAHCISRE